MSRFAFFDTNVLIYSDDSSLPEKQEQAIELIKAHQSADTLVISVQVLQEYFWTVTRKLRVPAERAQQKVESLAQNRVVRLAEYDVIHAIELHRLSLVSFWDALIVHAARVAGAEILYSEDMQHGSTLAGVRILNPFFANSSKSAK